MEVHSLKVVQPYFDALLDGSKTAELRRDDRAYKVGDRLVLGEWDGHQFTGRHVAVAVTHITRGLPWLHDGYCMLSFERKEITD